MNKTVAITSKNHKYANTYGGKIYQTDFCTEHPRNSKFQSWADRIESDIRFDNDCRKNMEVNFNA